MIHGITVQQHKHSIVDKTSETLYINGSMESSKSDSHAVKAHFYELKPSADTLEEKDELKDSFIQWVVDKGGVYVFNEESRMNEGALPPGSECWCGLMGEFLTQKGYEKTVSGRYRDYWKLK